MGKMLKNEVAKNELKEVRHSEEWHKSGEKVKYRLADAMKSCMKKAPVEKITVKEITEEWLYHLGVPTDQIEELAEHSAVCVPTMMPYITAFFMPRTKGDRPDVIPDGCVNFAFLGQFAETPRDTVFTLSLIHI